DRHLFFAQQTIRPRHFRVICQGHGNVAGIHCADGNDVGLPGNDQSFHLYFLSAAYRFAGECARARVSLWRRCPSESQPCDHQINGSNTKRDSSHASAHSPLLALKIILLYFTTPRGRSHKAESWGLCFWTVLLEG